jgi:hypothetical protein
MFPQYIKFNKINLFKLIVKLLYKIMLPFVHGGGGKLRHTLCSIEWYTRGTHAARVPLFVNPEEEAH